MTWWSTFFSLSLCVASCFDTAIVTGILIISSWMMSSMSFSRQSDGHSLAHSLTHSILIKLFIKPGLNNFLLPPLLSIVFSKSVQSSSGRFFDEGGLERRTFLPDQLRAWIRVCRTPRRPFWFHVIFFHRYVVFWLSAFAHT